MSEQMIARWNAIPLERPSETNLKRPRPDESEEDDDGDDVSLVSRSPSPRHDSMDVDEGSIHKYDEYVRGHIREVITVDTKIKPTNKGFELLAKLGWREGQPVGLSPDGRTEPVPFHVKSDLTGLGKVNQDFEMIETTVSQRRGMDSERQQRESEEQRKFREDTVARKFALNAEISSTLRSFYCELCDKQFKNVAQYDEHTNSYAHHHKARFRDMQASSRIRPQVEIDKRKEKERKREEKELRKIAAANGIRMPKTSASTSATDVTTADAVSSMDIDGTPAEPPKVGWATVSGASIHDSSNAASGCKKSGWATIGESSSMVPQPPSTQAPPPPPPPPGGSNGYQQLPRPPHLPPQTLPPPMKPISRTPSFRAAGRMSLDAGSSQMLPSSQLNNSSTPTPAKPHEGRWTHLDTEPSFTSFAPLPPTEAPPPLDPSCQTQFPSSLPVVPPDPKPVRSNWQHFQKGIRRKK